MTITTSTGFGAVLKAQITPRPEYQGEIKQVIDCITPRDGIVGYVNGEAYYGSFHVMPNGIKMTGAKHSDSDFIIYDTPAQSRTSVSPPKSTSTTQTTPTVTSPSISYTSPTQTNVSNTTTPSQTTTSSTPQTGTTDTSSQQTSGQSDPPSPPSSPSGGGSSGSGGGYGGY